MKLLVRRPDHGYIDSDAWIPKSAVNVEGVRRALTFQVFDEQKMNLLVLYKETDHHIIVPREFWQPSDFQFPMVDCRPQRYPAVTIGSRIRLDHEFKGGALVPTGDTVQREAMDALLSARGGVLQLACGKGKTVVLLDYIARRGVPALIVVDTTQLLHQWQEEIALFLDVPGGVGLIQGDVFDWKKALVMSTYHTLAARAPTMPEEVRRWFGVIGWDEAHHIAAPLFSRSANLFYGTRIGLTATPDRDDGMHVVYNFNLGQVVYKNLRQDLRPRFFFVWTGLGLDPHSQAIQTATRDINGELHIGKLASYLGSWTPRIAFAINQIQMAVAQNRKVLVLSKSVDALVNLLAAWNGQASLITDIPFPTAADVGELVPPQGLDKKHFDKVQRELGACIKAIETAQEKLPDPKAATKIQAELQKKAVFDQLLEAHRVFKKCEVLWNKKRAQYIKDLLAIPSTAGLMIYRIKPEARTKMLREKQVTFAIAKYGREGLNEKSLDTCIVNEPISSRNSLQQLMGRLLRKKEGKQAPVVVFLEDDIGLFIGMCKKLRRHLTSWPADEGGPFTYENIRVQPLSNGARLLK